jgi:hypothetical protein
LNLKIDGSCVFEVKKPAKDNFDARKCWKGIIFEAEKWRKSTVLIQKTLKRHRLEAKNAEKSQPFNKKCWKGAV